MTPILGIDPGYKRTGMVLRAGPTCLQWCTVERAGDETEVGVGAVYVHEVVAMANRMLTWAEQETTGETRVAVEGLRKPSPHVRLTNVTMVIGAGLVLGAVLAYWPDAVVIPPGGNGGGALVSYPEALVTAAERRGGLNRAAGTSSRVSHARSAWDVAGAARMMRGAA